VFGKYGQQRFKDALVIESDPRLHREPSRECLAQPPRRIDHRDRATILARAFLVTMAGHEIQVDGRHRMLLKFAAVRTSEGMSLRSSPRRTAVGSS